MNIPAPYQTLIFDLGGVLINYDLEADVEALASVGLPDYFSWSQYPGLQQVCNAYLNGLSTEDDFLRQLRPFARPDATDDELIHSMIAVMADLPKSRLDTLAALRQRGHRLVLLSNINERTWRYSEHQFLRAGYRVTDIFAEADVFLSFRLGLAKPDTAIYRHVIGQTGIDPSRALFLDDTAANVEAARSVGITSILVPMNHSEEPLQELLAM